MSSLFDQGFWLQRRKKDLHYHYLRQPLASIIFASIYTQNPGVTVLFFPTILPRPLPTCLRFAAAARHASAVSRARFMASFTWLSSYEEVWATGMATVTAPVQGAWSEMSSLRQQPIE